MASFRTKRGYCHVDGESVRLESSLRLQFRHYRDGTPRESIPSLALLAFAVGYPIYLLVTGETQTLLYWGGAVAAVFVGIVAFNRWRGYSRDTEIPLADITHVRITDGSGQATGPQVVVFYHQNGETKRRPITMPSRSFSFSASAREQARDLFEQQGIPVES